MSRFTERHLDPASRLGEILFGFIMVLTVTLTASFSVADGKKGARQLLLAALGSNVAWGIIDASMYIMNVMVVRRGKIRLVEAVQRASNPEVALGLVKDRVEPEPLVRKAQKPSASLSFHTLLEHTLKKEF